VFIVAWEIVAWVAARALVVDADLSSADAIVVLSGSSAYVERTHKAAELYRAGRAPLIWLTDDHMRGGWSNALQRNPYFVERATDDGDVASGARKPRIECLPPAFEPLGGRVRPRDRRLGGVELELRRALRVCERCEPGGRTGCAGRRGSGASQEDDRRARHEVSRTLPHRAADRTTRI